MFSALSAVSFLAGHSIVLCLFGSSLFGRLFNSRKSNLTATVTSTMAVRACVIILCLFVYVTKQHREKATFCIFERTWTLWLPVCELRLRALSTICLVWLPSLCLGVCLLCARLSKHFSAAHSVVFLYSETKRQTDPPRKNSHNARVISVGEMGTMSKNNLRAKCPQKSNIVRQDLKN